MTASIPPGMDNPYYPFSPIDRRLPLVWPKGNRLAFWVMLAIEYWELQAPPGSHKDPRFVGEYGSYDPDYRTWTQREYGNRVGIFRVLDVLDRHGIKATVALNSAAAKRYPYLVEQCRQRGYEFIGHGSHATRMLTGKMNEEEERAAIRDALDTLGRTTGKRPRGWHGQDFGESQRTPRLLAEAGLDFVADWPNDDQPYAMTMDRRFVSLPTQPEWDDVQLLWLRRVETSRYPAIVAEAFDGLYAEGGRVFCLALHPWLIGMAHRIRYLDEALKRIAGRSQVWQATAGEIVDAFNAASSGQ
ncbi:polysaccharide deacetylase family protein [Reyranella sp. CPCC 100927]|uniref:polysaccharide deacetylase family protein n=1 Tax=Reyranella sp. CPCC 100927 TaxID=2599616 RepID=UPI0011B3BE48|nr:polysaccharide deacetylase family protein [Reyranella sp. CPCC 100927]TWT10832.1 polysaccharide deacetylase family protein [Reyranella sp. CPCC 100927]